MNVAADIYYRDTSELHRLIEETRAMPYVKDVEWSEVVKKLSRSGRRSCSPRSSVEAGARARRSRVRTVIVEMPASGDHHSHSVPVRAWTTHARRILG